MKKLLLGAGVLLLSACGSPAPPALPPTTTTPAPITPTTPPADTPADATVSQEFLFSRKQSRALLGSLNLQPLDTVDLGNRLRVVLSVTRPRTGASKGRASAVFIWGNQTVNLSGSYILGLSRKGQDSTLQSTNGKMNLAVSYPDYQAKVTKNTAYSANDEALCAVLTFNLKAAGDTWDSNAPVKVCEEKGSREVEDNAITNAANGTYYRVDSIGISRVKYIRLTGEAQRQETTIADIRRLLNVPGYREIKALDTNDFTVFFHSEPAFRNDRKQEKKAVRLLRTMYDFYGYRARAFAIQESPERVRIVYVGWNRLGIAGVEMWRFTQPGGITDPAYGNAKTYPSLWREGGSVTGTVQVGPHDPGAAISGRYAVRSATTCTAGVNVTLDRELQYDFTFDTGSNGLTTTQFTIEAMSDTGQDVVIDYAVTVTFGGQSKTYTGVACDILTPAPVVIPSVNDVRPYPHLYSDPRNSQPPAGASVSLEGFDGSVPAWNYPGTMQASGTYIIENAPECGAASRSTISSGNLVYQVWDYVEMVGFGLTVPPADLLNLTRNSRLVYQLTLTGKDGPRVIEGATCIDWTDPPPPPDPVAPWQPQEVMQDGGIRIFGTHPSPNSWNFRTGTFYWVEGGQATLLPHENRDGNYPGAPGLWTYNLDSSLILVYPPAGSNGTGTLEIRP